MDRRTTYGLLAALGISLTTVGCGDRTAGSEGPTVVQFWNGFSGPDGATMEKIVTRFNESQSEVRVEMQIIPWGTFYDKLTLGLAFGGAPDVFVIHAPRIAEFASQDALLTIDHLVEDGQIPVDDFVERPWKAAQYRGKQIGVPLDCHPIGLYYNLDLFEKAGIRKPPETYDEFIDAARKLTLDTNGDGRSDQWGFAFTWLHSNGEHFLNQFGTAFVSSDLKRGAIDTPEGRAALQRMVDIWKVEKVAPRPEGQDAWLGFLTGRVAMALEGVYMKSGLDNQKGLRYAAAPSPQFGPVKATWAGSHVLCMPKQLSRKSQTAVVKFIRYLSNNSLEWAKGGQLPVRKSILESSGFQALPVQREIAKQLDQVVFEPPTEKLNQLSTFGDAAIEAAINELLSVEEAAAQADRRINTVLQRGAKR